MFYESADIFYTFSSLTGRESTRTVWCVERGDFHPEKIVDTTRAERVVEEPHALCSNEGAMIPKPSTLLMSNSIR